MPSSPAIVRDHPRIRGEHSPCLRARTIATGSSPHTRGARRQRPVRDRRPGIIPAYAGSTLEPRRRANTITDHPRIRGEHRPRGFRSAPGPGSSPHTRGALPRLAAKLLKTRIIPAYAGSTTISMCGAGTRADHPRIRGEHGLCDLGPEAKPGSSPHTRGARPQTRRSP